MMYMCNIGSMRKTLLWENPNPSNSFSSNTVYLSDIFNHYKFISVVFLESTVYSTYDIEIITPVEKLYLYGSGAIPAAVQYNVYTGGNVRYFSSDDLDSDRLSFSDCTKIGGTGASNGALIPIKVYGIN